MKKLGVVEWRGWAGAIGRRGGERCILSKNPNLEKKSGGRGVGGAGVGVSEF